LRAIVSKTWKKAALSAGLVVGLLATTVTPAFAYSYKLVTPLATLDARFNVTETMNTVRLSWDSQGQDTGEKTFNAKQNRSEEVLYYIHPGSEI
jgi:hypothetical protein